LRGVLSKLDELAHADEVRVDERVAPDALNAGCIAQLPGSMLRVELVLGRGLSELVVAPRDLCHHLGLEALELVAILQVVLGQSRLGKRREDALVAALVELLAQLPRVLDLLDELGKLFTGDRRTGTARQRRVAAHGLEQVRLERAGILEIQLGLALL